MLILWYFCLIAITDAVRPKLTMEQFLAQPIKEDARRLTGQALVNFVNQRQPFFKASFSKQGEERKYSLMKSDYMRMIKERRKNSNVTIVDGTKFPKTPIPESFDAREAWPYCPSVRDIRDQSHCGSCWAVSAASTMSDRLCIATKGENTVLLSDTEILACCGDDCGMGCEGGDPLEAWHFIQRSGICTGGHYATKDNCKPYPFHPCGRHPNQTYYGECPKDHLYRTPACKPYCQYSYHKRLDQDKVYGTSSYNVKFDEETIQREIMKNGPVHASFTVYEDFHFYKSGIYVHTAGKETGGHAVKIIGWGVEDGTKFWLISNSWGTDWGEDGGYYRMVRGVNNCGLEEDIVAGLLG
ncbi:hypothetical protein Q1695_016442 [Nippostrongylus brasiliensis]|nr:hypothetical protein Q1695_016442 [Nippostrongylus brasiliensis]